MKYFLAIACFFILKNGFTQSLAINTDGSTANTSALLDIKSTNKGLLLPRMTKAQKNAIGTPATGLLVFQISPDSIGFQYYNGTQWLWLDPFVSNTWKTTGNTATDTAINFIGTTDNMPLRFKQNGTYLAQWNLNNGNYFIGDRSGIQKPSAMQNSIAIGDSALADVGNLVSPATSDFSVAVGYKALKKHVSQIGNVAIGAFTLQNFVSNTGGGFGSVAVGYQAMNRIIGGEQNIGIGAFALVNDTTGTGNSAMGARSLALKKTGNFNTASGFNAGITLRTGNENTFLGANAFSSLDSLQNAAAVGARAQVDTSNAMVLGSINGFNGATSSVNVGIGTTKPKAAFHVSRGSYGGNLIIPSSRTLLIEDNTSSYIQLLHPTNSESGILAGNSVTTIKSALVFTPDSAIQFRTGGNFNNDMYIANNGRVGIGTVTPSGTLHVVQNGFNLANAKYTSSPAAIFENGNAFGSTALQLMCKSNNDFSIFSGTDSISIRSGITFNSDSSISFATGLSFQSVLIAKNGNVGIGIFTPNPVAKLDANGTFRLGISGSINSALIKDTINIDVPSIAADGEQTVNIALAGVTTNGAVSLSPGADLPTGIIIAWARISSSGNVRIRFKNTSASAIDPIPMNYFISVVQ